MGQTLRILYVGDRPPLPPTAGDRQRSHLLIRALAQLGQADGLLMGRAPQPLIQQQIEKMFHHVQWASPMPRGGHGAWRMVRPIMPSLVDRLAHNLGSAAVWYEPDPLLSPMVAKLHEANQYDVIVGRYLRPTCQCGVFDRGVSVVVDIDDLDTRVYESRLNVPGLPGWQRTILKRHLKQYEQAISQWMPRAAHLWLASEADLPLVEHASVSVLPNIPFAGAGDSSLPLAPPRADCRTVLFVGSMTHRVNIDAMDRFVQRVWPSVMAQCPDALLRIVGSKMSDAMKQRWSQPGVEPIGFVDDLRHIYSACALLVVPIYEGGGTKIKVLESLRMGRAVLTTPHGHYGYEKTLKAGEAISVAADETQLAAECVALLNDPDRRQAMAATGCAAVEAHFGFDRFAQVVRQTIEQVVS